MASTVEGSALTEAHRRRQLALRAVTVRDLLTIWAAFNIKDIAGTWPAVETALVALVQARWAVSAGLSSGYYSEFRVAEQVAGSAVALPVSPPPTREVAVPLRIAGLVGARALVGANRQDASAVTFTNVAGEVSRQTLNGGRSTLLEAVKSDRKALGYLRVTAASPCAYCAGLAARGPVYLSADRALLSQGSARYHKSCACSVEAVFDRAQPWPGRGQEFKSLYDEAKLTAASSDEPGVTAAIAFRRTIEGR